MGSFEEGDCGGSYVYSELKRSVSGGLFPKNWGGPKRTYVEDGVPTDATAAGGEFEAIAGILDCFLRRWGGPRPLECIPRPPGLALTLAQASSGERLPG